MSSDDDGVSLTISSIAPEDEVDPKLKPRRFVVGVPEMIQRRSALILFKNWFRSVYCEAALWPSSRTSLFQRTCRSGETSRTPEHEQFGMRAVANSSHLHVYPTFMSEDFLLLLDSELMTTRISFTCI